MQQGRGKKEGCLLSTFEILCGVLLIFFSVIITLVVLFQEGKEKSLGNVMTGSGGKTFLSEGKTRSIDVFLAKWTRFIAIVLFILTALINVVTYFHLFGVR